MGNIMDAFSKEDRVEVSLRSQNRNKRLKIRNQFRHCGRHRRYLIEKESRK